MLLIWIDDKSIQSNFYIEIIIVILFLLYFVLELYLDIKYRHYSITIAKFIIVADIVLIISFIALCYLHFRPIDKTNFDLLWERAENIRHISLIMLLIPSIKSIVLARDSN